MLVGVTWPESLVVSLGPERSLSYERRRSRLGAVCCLAVAQLLAFLPAFGREDPGTTGQFSSIMTWPREAVHAQLLPTGKVLWWPSFDEGDNPTIWDPVTNTNTAVAHAGSNIFCSGHAFLPDG